MKKLLLIITSPVVAFGFNLNSEHKASLTKIKADSQYVSSEYIEEKSNIKL